MGDGLKKEKEKDKAGGKSNVIFKPMAPTHLKLMVKVGELFTIVSKDEASPGNPIWNMIKVDERQKICGFHVQLQDEEFKDAFEKVDLEVDQRPPKFRNKKKTKDRAGS